MSEFSKFISEKIYEKNLIKKQSIRELSKEIGISHDYLGRIIHGKVIAPKRETQEKIAKKLLSPADYQKFYDLAAKEREEVPIDILKKLSKESNKWNQIRKILEVNE